MIKIILNNFMTKGMKKKRRDEIRINLNKALKEKSISRTEYDLIWDLATELNIHMAEYYFEQATNKEG